MCNSTLAEEMSINSSNTLNQSGNYKPMKHWLNLKRFKSTNLTITMVINN